MSPKQITESVRAQPFRPFSVVTTGGRSYDVDHPELVLVAKSGLYIARRIDHPTHGEMVDDPVIVSYAYVAALEPKPERAA